MIRSEGERVPRILDRFPGCFFIAASVAGIPVRALFTILFAGLCEREVRPRNGSFRRGGDARGRRFGAGAARHWATFAPDRGQASGRVGAMEEAESAVRERPGRAARAVGFGENAAGFGHGLPPVSGAQAFGRSGVWAFGRLGVWAFRAECWVEGAGTLPHSLLWRGGGKLEGSGRRCVGGAEGGSGPRRGAGPAAAQRRCQRPLRRAPPASPPLK